MFVKCEKVTQVFFIILYIVVNVCGMFLRETKKEMKLHQSKNETIMRNKILLDYKK